MAIDENVRKRIIEDWHNSFPELSAYSKGKMYKIVGPIAIGLELIKLPRTEEYRPHFVIYPLWRKDMNTSLYVPILIHEYYNNKRMQYSIPYEKHDTYFKDVLESISKQTQLSFCGDIELNKLFDFIDWYSKTSPLNAAPNSYWQAALQEAKLKIALFINIEVAQNILVQIEKRNWDKNHFKACGVEIDKWIQELHEVISYRDEFLKQIEMNKQDKKILKLKENDLIFR